MRRRGIGWGLRGALLVMPLGVGCASEPPPPHLAELREAEEELAVGNAESALERFQRANRKVRHSLFGCDDHHNHRTIGREGKRSSLENNQGGVRR